MFALRVAAALAALGGTAALDSMLGIYSRNGFDFQYPSLASFDVTSGNVTRNIGDWPNDLLGPLASNAVVSEDGIVYWLAEKLQGQGNDNPYLLCSHYKADGSKAHDCVELPFPPPDLGLTGLGIYMQPGPAGTVFMQNVEGLKGITATDLYVIKPATGKITSLPGSPILNYHALVEGSMSFMDNTGTIWLQMSLKDLKPDYCAMLPEPPQQNMRWKNKGQQKFNVSSPEECCSLCSKRLSLSERCSAYWYDPRGKNKKCHIFEYQVEHPKGPHNMTACDGCVAGKGMPGGTRPPPGPGACMGDPTIFYWLVPVNSTNGFWRPEFAVKDELCGVLRRYDTARDVAVTVGRHGKDFIFGEFSPSKRSSKVIGTIKDLTTIQGNNFGAYDAASSTLIVHGSRLGDDQSEAESDPIASGEAGSTYWSDRASVMRMRGLTDAGSTASDQFMIDARTGSIIGNVPKVCNPGLHTFSNCPTFLTFDGVASELVV